LETIKDDFKRLSLRREVNSNDIQQMKDDALLFFKEEFPVLFQCLEAKF